MLPCWNRKCAFGLAFAALAALHLSSSARAEEYPGAKVVALAGGRITFEHGGKTNRVQVDLALKIIDDKGKAHDPISGKRFLQSGNIVDITTKSVRVTPSKDEPRIVEIKFVSGKVADLPTPTPKPAGEVNLAPDPNFKGQVFGGDGWTREERWQAYIPTAKVGDFVEYEKNGKPGRLEVVEVGKEHDYVIYAQVSYALDQRDEMRIKKRLPTAEEQPPSAAKAKAKPVAKSAAKSSKKKSKTGTKKDTQVPKARPTNETIEVMGRKLECEIHYVDGDPFSWHSDEVPLDGLVKEDARNSKYMLTSFGRGE